MGLFKNSLKNKVGLIMDEEEHKEIETLSLEEQYQILQEFATNLIENIKDFETDFDETINKHFWELV